VASINYKKLTIAELMIISTKGEKQPARWWDQGMSLLSLGTPASK
jgi:hypothetical protein